MLVVTLAIGLVIGQLLPNYFAPRQALQAAKYRDQATATALQAVNANLHSCIQASSNPTQCASTVVTTTKAEISADATPISIARSASSGYIILYAKAQDQSVLCYPGTGTGSVRYLVLRSEIESPRVECPNSAPAPSPLAIDATMKAEAQDSGTKSNVSQIATAMEACFTEQNGTYTKGTCDSPIALLVNHFLRNSISNVTEVVSADANHGLVYGLLTADTSTCQVGTGSHKYYVYRTDTSLTKTECSDNPPTL
jgi:hypothetical protein